MAILLLIPLTAWCTDVLLLTEVPPSQSFVDDYLYGLTQVDPSIRVFVFSVGLNTTDCHTFVNQVKPDVLICFSARCYDNWAGMVSIPLVYVTFRQGDVQHATVVQHFDYSSVDFHVGPLRWNPVFDFKVLCESSKYYWSVFNTLRQVYFEQTVIWQTIKHVRESMLRVQTRTFAVFCPYVVDPPKREVLYDNFLTEEIQRFSSFSRNIVFNLFPQSGPSPYASESVYQVVCDGVEAGTHIGKLIRSGQLRSKIQLTIPCCLRKLVR